MVRAPGRGMREALMPVPDHILFNQVPPNLHHVTCCRLAPAGELLLSLGDSCRYRLRTRLSVGGAHTTVRGLSRASVSMGSSRAHVRKKRGVPEDNATIRQVY